MSRPKILFYNSKSYDVATFRRAREKFNAYDKLHFTFLQSKFNEETVSEAAGCAGICIFANETLSDSLLETIHKHASSVKFIAVRTLGYNETHKEAMEKYGIKIVGVPSYSPYAVAEHSIALLLSLNRNMHHAFFRTKQHNFSLDGLVGIDLFGKTVGIIGTGAIGMCAVKIFLGFGCKVIAYDIKPDEQVAKEKGFVYKSLDELLQESDVVSLYAPLNKETHHLIDSVALSKMKQGAMLINTSSGGLVDAKALVDCLKASKLRGAALDVYENEKDYFYKDYSQRVMDDDTLARLISMPNTIVTSHQAFLTEEALKNIAESLVQNLLKFFSESSEVKSSS
ncbi:unnamed protein product [Rotaria magnacalcarata]|uniref:D-lactate dehydrogenase n=2 Tax=Rotaria magnacalcarata TaxID=392030 RepID=A0A816LY36_9BILA|nr:unnamed protein product [Rotaria magnacalcarata]CAF1392470.1 unnamed protein product [Rotaria magnacalcarata]CAF1966064.1 unnamed protein product [Rotaria magnacalcarata]CAF1978998.1 unnamed protein product [Rotaria magnacalcarata]CAF2109869.1 unnamed protein product [Rotaria magnacalcarata]